MGINITRLVALSTTVIILFIPLQNGNPKTKSMVKHVNLSMGGGKGCSSPGLAVLQFLIL